MPIQNELKNIIQTPPYGSVDLEHGTASWLIQGHLPINMSSGYFLSVSKDHRLTVRHLNIFQRILRRVFGMYQDTHLATVKTQLNNWTWRVLRQHDQSGQLAAMPLQIKDQQSLAAFLSRAKGVFQNAATARQQRIDQLAQEARRQQEEQAARQAQADLEQQQRIDQQAREARRQQEELRAREAAQAVKPTPTPAPRVETRPQLQSVLTDISWFDNTIITNGRVFKARGGVPGNWQAGDSLTISSDSMADKGFRLITNNSRNNKDYFSAFGTVRAELAGTANTFSEKTAWTDRILHIQPLSPYNALISTVAHGRFNVQTSRPSFAVDPRSGVSSMSNWLLGDPVCMRKSTGPSGRQYLVNSRLSEGSLPL